MPKVLPGRCCSVAGFVGISSSPILMHFFKIRFKERWLGDCEFGFRAMAAVRRMLELFCWSCSVRVLSSSLACGTGKLRQRFDREIATAVAREAKVLSFGDGSQGALGHIDCYGGDSYDPEEVEGLPSDIVSVGAGHYHSLAVTEAGDLWAWGRNYEGQLGQRSIDSRETWHRPQRVCGLDSVEIQSATGSGVVSMAIAKDGSLWAWGKSNRGQLGLGPNVTHALVPARVNALVGQQVVQVALGWGHTIARTAEGHLYSWGFAADSRLGFQPGKSSLEVANFLKQPHYGDEGSEEAAHQKVQQDMEREKNPILVWEPVHADTVRSRRVTEIACGFDHSLTLNDEGELLSFGDNSLGQLGKTNAISTTHCGGENIISDCIVDGAIIRRVVHLGAGLGHSLALDAEGLVYSWGWNAGYQLGRDGDSSSPAVIKDLVEDKVASLSGGRVHSLALTSRGELWVWGSGRNGRLGLGSPADEPAPVLVESLESSTVLQASCGLDHTLILVST